MSLPNRPRRLKGSPEEYVWHVQIEPSPPHALLAVLAMLDPLDEDFPPILEADLDPVEI
ncbi:MAG: hypothetical protein WA184_22730 [Stellaceae bacterium]